MADAGQAQRRRAGGRARRVDALGRGRVGVGGGVGRGAQAARLAAERSGVPGGAGALGLALAAACVVAAGRARGALGRAVVRAVPAAIAARRLRVGVAVVAAGLVHRLLELGVVEPRRLERPAPAAMGERQARRAADVVLAHGVVAVEGGQCAGGLRAHDVGAHAVDAQARADPGDEQQRALVEHDPRQPLARGGDALGERRLVGGEARAHRVRVGVEGQPPAHDLDALRRIGARGDVDGEPEAVEQLRAQLALLRVHRADEQEARRVRDADRLALDVGAAHRGGVEEHVDEVVGQQVDLVDVEDAAVRGGEQAGLEGGHAVAQRAVEVERAEQSIGGRAHRQLDQRDGPALHGSAVVRPVRAPRAVEERIGVEATAGDDLDVRQQRRQRAHGGRLRRAALAAHEHAADARVDRAGEQRLAQRRPGRRWR